MPGATFLESIQTGADIMEMAQKIDPEIQRILDQLIAGYAPKRVILFGSRVGGRTHEDSDIDLLIIKETEERFLDRCFHVRRLLTDPQRRTPIDLFVLTPAELDLRLNIGDQFFEAILETGKTLYAA